jgi:hypothetical protein
MVQWPPVAQNVLVEIFARTHTTRSCITDVDHELYASRDGGRRQRSEARRRSLTREGSRNSNATFYGLIGVAKGSRGGAFIEKPKQNERLL